LPAIEIFSARAHWHRGSHRREFPEPVLSSSRNRERAVTFGPNMDERFGEDDGTRLQPAAPPATECPMTPFDDPIGRTRVTVSLIQVDAIGRGHVSSDPIPAAGAGEAGAG
jgi:hypothetical protein